MHPTFDKPFTFDRVIRIIITVLVIIGLFFLLKKLSDVLVPFFLAWLLAYLIHPLVNFFQYKLKIKYRGLSVFLAMTMVIVVITVITSYSIHYTKLYDGVFGNDNGYCGHYCFCNSGYSAG